MAILDFDGLDRQLLHALQVDGRAPFNRIADVLGVSDQTVARRYARLRSSGRVRVTGRTDPALLGEVSWFVRIQCVPSVAMTVGGALARRADTSWVKVTSGGTEIVCVVRAATSQDSETLLLETLPRTPNVLNVSANCLLHVFFGGPQSIIEALTPDQVARLTPDPPHSAPSGSEPPGSERSVPESPGAGTVASGLPVAGPRVVLDEGDRRMVELLQVDGRAGYSGLASAIGRPLTTVRRRVAELRTTGALYFDVDLDYRSLNMLTQTMLWLSVAPDRMPATGRALAAHPEVPFVAATTGSTNLYASVLCPDPAALFTYLSTKVAALPAIQRMETAPVIRTLKSL